MRSLVDGKVYAIFSQAPVAPVDNFWEAVYYKDVELVVMLCMFNDPKRGRQAEQYWPNPGKPLAYSQNTIKVENAAQKTHSD